MSEKQIIYTEFVIRPIGGDIAPEKQWGVNAHMTDDTDFGV